MFLGLNDFVYHGRSRWSKRQLSLSLRESLFSLGGITSKFMSGSIRSNVVILGDTNILCMYV